ncbi:Ribokinase-like protein [Aspergillus cavernicola]|uniref:Ribokinase-like protein n=1 Tax=Aspergillus cavernicola TaxID=176166 RepID=A0ABR4J0X7_9EURO
MPEHSLSFLSLGSVVLDEIRIPNQKPLKDVLGGSGAYATLGARLFLLPPLSHSLGWMLHIGNDFPRSIRNSLESWGTTLVIDRESDKPSTRGLLEYRDITFGPKDFRYITPVLAIQESRLKGTSLLTAKTYHYLDSPQNIKRRVSTLLSLRNETDSLERPLIIWEPAPLSIKPENLQACLNAAHEVDVFSPNHLELAGLFGESPSATLDKEKIESFMQVFLNRGVGPGEKGIVLIRAGEHGCLVGARNIAPTWLPPFYNTRPEGKQSARVVDPTGAGNAFLGAWAVGYLGTGDAVKAACYGAVGASFALEQVGMPEKRDEGDIELWNGVDVLSRLHEYQESTGFV